jgi:MFS family permease
MGVVMADPHAEPVARLVRDVHGRTYRVGEKDRELVGRSRRWMLAAAWLAMLAVGATQYGYGVIVPTLAGTYGWYPQGVFLPFVVWVLCQAVVIVALTRRRHRAKLTPRVTVLLGAALCLAGVLTLAHSSSFVLVALGYGIVGGAGAGLVYGTCLDVIARWYPERPAQVGRVSGAFAYGSIPLALAAGLVSGPGPLSFLLDLTGVLVLVAGGWAGMVLVDPPRRWWPADLDPRVWAVDKSLNPALRRNRPAIRSYTPGELVRCPTAWLMYLVVICVSAVALFDAAYLAVFVRASGWGGGYAAFSVAVLVAGSGLVRGPAGTAGDRFGRDRVLRVALGVGAAGQLLLLGGGEHAKLAVLLVGAGVAGASSGACYALLPGLVDAYFGEDTGLPNFGILYSAKGVGGVLGVGLAAFVVFPAGYLAGFAIAAVVSMAGAVLLRVLRRPGLPRLLLPVPGVAVR